MKRHWAAGVIVQVVDLFSCSPAPDQSTPSGAARALIEALEAGRKSQALTMISSRTRDSERLVDGAIDDIGEAGGIESFETYPVESWADSARLDVVIELETGDRESETWRFYKEQEQWVLFWDWGG